MKKIYIAGAGGMLGEAFYSIFSKNYELKCTDIDLNANWLTYCDFRDKKSYEESVYKFRPDYLFHLGAITDLEYSEQNPDNTYLTNTISVEYASRIANDLNIPILYISTAGIFDGKQQTYDDWDKPNPLGVYARSKFQGELIVKENVEKHIVCRAGWMMGGGPKKDKKFINKLYQQIKAGKTELNIVNDRLGTPTYTHDFANNVKFLLEKEEWGLYNMVCEGMTSRIEVAEELLKILSITKIKVNQVDSSFFQKEYFAPRPESEQLINFKLNLKKMNSMRNWRICLNEYVNQHFL